MHQQGCISTAVTAHPKKGARVQSCMRLTSQPCTQPQGKDAHAALPQLLLWHRLTNQLGQAKPRSQSASASPGVFSISNRQAGCWVFENVQRMGKGTIWVEFALYTRNNKTHLTPSLLVATSNAQQTRATTSQQAGQQLTTADLQNAEQAAVHKQCTAAERTILQKQAARAAHCTHNTPSNAGSWHA